MIILLVLLFILIILRLFVVKEGFELNKQTVDSYNKYIAFYNPFMVNWKKAITSAIAMNIEQKPLEEPTELSSSTTKAPSQEEMNSYISKMSKDIGKSLPPVTDPIPDDIDYNTLVERIPLIKSDPSAYINALEWMNGHLQESQDKLKDALKGKIEHFEDKCPDISACIANNPELIKKIAEAQKENEQKDIILTEESLSSKVASFFSEPLLTSSQKNELLVANAKQIQNDAQSGKMLDKLDLPAEDEISFEIPKGGDTLSKMKNSDPDKYNKMQESNSMWFSIKQLLEEINNGLPS
jgi:hypothetical protein